MESRHQRKQQELVRKQSPTVFLMMAAAVMLLLGLQGQAQDRAIESTSATNSQTLCRFAVALPEMEGPLTLGIFSPEGKLVRLLYRDAPIDSIPAGLNGLLVSWDGKDDSGVAVPDGIYHARGLVHGKLLTSLMPSSDGDWYISRLQATNDSSLLFMQLMQPPFPKNRITMIAAQDALLQRRPLLSITAQGEKNTVVITADGLPILAIPLEFPKTGAINLELRHGSSRGTAELIINSSEEKSLYTLSGLNQLVPLDAGALPMPPVHY